MSRAIRTGILILASLCLANSVTAAEDEADSSNTQLEIPEPTLFISEHSNQFNNSRVNYRVVAGETYIRDIEDKAKASIFTFAYTKTNLAEDEVRPVTFVWNGGPGSASTWLHMGGYGPKRIVVPSDGQHAGLPPYPILEAPETILDVTVYVVRPYGTI